MRNQSKGLIIIIALMALFASACTHNARQDTIKTALIATNAARDAFVSYDAVAQDKIVEAATSLEDGKTKLKEYRAKRDKVLALFPVVYYSIIAASQANDDASFNKMKASLKSLLDAITPIIGGDK